MDGVMHRVGLMFRAESSLPAMHHVFRAVSQSVKVPVLVCDFLTNIARHYAEDRGDDSDHDSRLESLRMRVALESAGLLPASEVNFAVVPVWRIIGDCCLRAENGLNAVEGIDASFHSFCQTGEEEDNEDEKLYLVSFDLGEKGQPTFWGMLEDCTTLAKAEWYYIEEKYDADLASELEERETGDPRGQRPAKPQAEFESLVRQKYEKSTRMDFDEILATAASQGDIRVMQHAIQAGADVRSVHVVASARDRTVLQWLVDAGADVNAASDAGETALMRLTGPHVYSFDEDELASIEALLEFGAAVNAVAADGQTALLAVAGSSASHAKDAIALLLSHGADARAVDQNGNTTVMLAAGAGNEDALAILKALVAAGASPALANREGRTPLMAAAGDSSEAASDVLGYLLACGCDVNAADENGTTALMVAAESWDDGALRRVRVLATGGADGAAKNRDGQTAFSLASEDSRALRAFLKKLSAPGKK